MDHREEAIAEARQLLDQDLVVLDTETTGLSVNDEIIELAAIDRSGQVLIDTLLQPKIRIPYEATQVHGITNQDVKKAPYFAHMAKRIVEALEGRYVTAYNWEYDIRMLRQTAAKYGRGARWSTYSKKGFAGTDCIMLIYGKYRGDWNDHYGNYRWHKLELAAEQCGISVDGPAHRAITDARTALAVLKHMADAS